MKRNAPADAGHPGAAIVGWRNSAPSVRRCRRQLDKHGPAESLCTVTHYRYEADVRARDSPAGRPLRCGWRVPLCQSTYCTTTAPLIDESTAFLTLQTLLGPHGVHQCLGWRWGGRQVRVQRMSRLLDLFGRYRENVDVWWHRPSRVARV